MQKDFAKRADGVAEIVKEFFDAVEESAPMPTALHTDSAGDVLEGMFVDDGGDSGDVLEALVAEGEGDPLEGLFADDEPPDGWEVMSW